MKFYKTDWITALCLAVVLFGGKLDFSGIFTPADTTAPTVTIAEPSAELKAIVTPIAAVVTGTTATADRAALSDFCLALAEFHSRDKAILVNGTKLLQRHNELSLQAMYQGTGMKGRYATLGASIDIALGKQLGIVGTDGKYKVQAMDAAAAGRVAEFYSALAWAFSQPLPKKG